MSAATTAADFLVKNPEPVDRGDRFADCQIEFRGELVEGDADKLASFLAASEHYFDSSSAWAKSDGDGYALCVSGPGGSFAEALKISDLLSDSFTVTIVPARAECLSACAVVFMAGLFGDESWYAARLLRPRAKLGFHAPSINISGDAPMPVAMVQSAYAAALEDIHGVVSRLALAGLSTNPRMDINLLSKLLETPPEQMYIVTTVDELGRFRLDYDDGPNDQVRNSAANLAQACMNYGNWIDGYPSQSAADYPVEPERIQDSRTMNGEMAVQVMLDAGMWLTRCIFFLPDGASMLGDDSRVEVYSEASDRTEIFGLPTWAYLRPDMTLDAAAERAGG